MTMWKWSRTAASNNTADSTVNLREGQGPSTLNDSARAMMAAVAKYRDDLGGTIATGGTSTAYTVTSYQSYSSLADGRIVAFTPHATNGDNPTLNVDSLGAKPLRAQTGVALGAGSLILGTPYVAVYRLSADEWLLHGYFGTSTIVPVGTVLPYCGSTAPSSNFVLCYGQAISRSTYATLFNLVSTAFGVGDGSSTFNVPDLRGRVIAGYDSMGGSSANRLTALSGGVEGDTIGATGGAESHVITQPQLPNINLSAASLTANSETTVNISNGTLVIRSTGATVASGTSTVSWSTATLTASASTSTTLGGNVPLGGSGNAHNNVQPTIILPYIIRVL